MRRIWTDSEISILKKDYPIKAAQTIANLLNRPISSVYGKAHSLGLEKAESFWISEESGYAKRLKDGKKSQFSKGRVSFNKGLKQEEYMSADAIERTKETRFKKGDKPHNAVCVGTTVIDTDGYHKEKIAEPDVWRYSHHLLWEKQYGDIPKGSNICFIDGDKNHLELSNLTIKTDAELMVQNTIHKYPKEVQEIIKLNNKLIRKINNHGKK